MTKIKVLIIDDSMVVRHLLSEIITSDSELEVIGTASNGIIGMEKIERLNPDVVIMDIEMPDMDGLTALPLIRKKYPRLPIIMCSTLTSRGAEATFKALSLGATDYVAKPTNSASLANATEGLKLDLLPKVKFFGIRRLKEKTPASSQPKVNETISNVSSFSRSLIKEKIDIVAIGVSTGGPNALEKLLSSFPENFPLPIVIVQHMPPTFTKMLADHLNSKCPLKINEAKSGDILVPGQALIAPGGCHMALARIGTKIQVTTNMDAPENSCRPAVDVLFRSVNALYGNKTLAVIMTGMGSDGLKGCELIHASGGQILAQDEATSVVWGMPGFIARAGIANAILPLDRLAPEIIERCLYGRNPMTQIKGANL